MKRSVIGITPDGECVRFSSISELSEKLGWGKSFFKRNIGTGEKVGGWDFLNDDGRETVPFRREMKETFVYRKVRKNKGVVRIVEEVEEEIEGEVIATGYYLKGFSPLACPFCKMIIGRNIEDHFRQCSAGHRYKIKHGIIKVYE